MNVLIYKESDETEINEDGVKVCLYTKATNLTFEQIRAAIKEETGYAPIEDNDSLAWLLVIEDARVLALTDWAQKEFEDRWAQLQENSCT